MRRLLIFLLILLLAGTGLFFWLWPDEGAAAVGPPVALCPGPDLYGYTCAEGSAFAYVDATEDMGLQADDNALQVPLPFPFVFYGTSYETVWAGSNGILQFGAPNPLFNNSCLDGGPAPGMGDMIAPYWDDLDLTLAGALETATVGEAPNRIFVVEWDQVPPFANPEESVTFAVQLHETSNDIVFLYPDASTAESVRGSSATAGLQSEAQGVALQYSCNQAVIADAAGLHIRHPAAANEEIGLAEGATAAGVSPLPLVKGSAALLQEQFSSRGAAALPTLRRHWLARSDPLQFTWEWADLDGDGRRDLVALWHGTAAEPAAAHIALFSQVEAETAGAVAGLEARFASPLSTRETAFPRPQLIAVRDLTGDSLADVILADREQGRVAVLAQTEAQTTLHYLPHTCQGTIALRDVDGDGQVDLLRGGCGPLSPKNSYTWQAGQFARLSPQ